MNIQPLFVDAESDEELINRCEKDINTEIECAKERLRHVDICKKECPQALLLDTYSTQMLHGIAKGFAIAMLADGDPNNIMRNWLMHSLELINERENGE